MKTYKPFVDAPLRVPFLKNSLCLSFTCSSHQYSTSEADLQSCHRFETGAFADSEPKGCGEDLAMTRVLAQPERHRRAGETFEYSMCPKVETRGEWFSGAL
jgi:hypothetical protein